MTSISLVMQCHRNREMTCHRNRGHMNTPSSIVRITGVSSKVKLAHRGAGRDRHQRSRSLAVVLLTFVLPGSLAGRSQNRFRYFVWSVRSSG